MKIQPPLFTPAPTTQSQTDVTQARRAFEAMLSAGAARTQTPSPLATTPKLQSQPTQTTQTHDEPNSPIIRPGRVLDIRA